MANIISSKTYLNDLEISADAPVTTQLNTRIGGAINYLNDKTDSLQSDVNAINSAADVVKRQLFQQAFTGASPDYIVTTPGVLAMFGCSIAITQALGPPGTSELRQLVDIVAMDRFSLQAITDRGNINQIFGAGFHRLTLYFNDFPQRFIYCDITYVSVNQIKFNFSQTSGSTTCILQGYALYSAS